MDYYTIFPRILNMSLTGSIVILAVLLARFLLKKAPKVWSYALWAVVLFRLLCPVSISSDFSLLGLFDAPATESVGAATVMEYIPQDIVHTEFPAVDTPIDGVNAVINEALPQGTEQLAADPLEAPTSILTWLWLLGILGLLLYAIISYIQLRWRLIGSVPLRENIYLSDHISSPFVMGLCFPKIYLPSALAESEMDYIIRHEQYHIRHGDHIAKLLGFLALCIHWFNPLVWLAFLLSGRDMEMRCDEAVIKSLGEDVRADYSASLLHLATGRPVIAGTPLAFGEGNTKSRIRNLSRWKKPALWVTLLAGVVCGLVVVICAMNPGEDSLHAPEPFCRSYRVEQVVFSAPMYSFVYTPETAPLYSLSADYRLSVLEDKSSSNWLHPGYFKETKLTKDNFDAYLMDEIWSGDVDAETLRKENQDAWVLHVEPEVEDSVFYYLLLQKNGDVYLTYGYFSEAGSRIRWVFKMTPYDLLTCTASSNGIFSYIEPAFYPDGFDWDYDALPSGEINETGVLIFQADWETDTLTVSEDYYEYTGNGGFVNKTVYDPSKNADGTFTLNVKRKNDTQDEKAYYFIEGPSGTYVFRVDFPLAPSETAAENGSAEWTWSNSKSALRFDFDLPYDTLSVSCEESTLYYIGSDNTIHTAHALEVPAGSYFCWNPRNDSGALVDSASIQFILSGETNLMGTIYITADPQAPNTFTATVVGTNLYIERVGGGTVISLIQ